MNKQNATLEEQIELFLSSFRMPSIKDGSIISGYKKLSGNIFLDEPLYIAKTGVLEIESGTTISFGPQAYLFSHGSIIASGKKSNPIFFKGQESTSGNIILLGKENVSKIFDNCVFTKLHGQSSSRFLNVVDESVDQKYFGGAISSLYGELTITNSLFYENDAIGGAIFANGSKLNINNSVFKNNNSSLFGGAIFLYAGSAAKIEKSIFSRNVAEYGGAIACINSTLNTFKSQVLNGWAKLGAGIFIGNSHIYSKTDLFSANHAKYGAAITAYGGVVRLDKSEISNNSSDFAAAGLLLINAEYINNAVVFSANTPDDILEKQGDFHV